MKFTPYLNFDGDCAGAFTFYAEVFGGTAEVMTIGDSPVAGEVPADWHDRVMHASLAVGDQILLGSDARPGEYRRPHSIYVAVRIGDADEAERVFHALAEGGTVTMPMGETFWAKRFGILVDRYGTPWLINCERDLACVLEGSA